MQWRTITVFKAVVVASEDTEIVQCILGMTGIDASRRLLYSFPVSSSLLKLAQSALSYRRLTLPIFGMNRVATRLQKLHENTLERQWRRYREARNNRSTVLCRFSSFKFYLKTSRVLFPMRPLLLQFNVSRTLCEHRKTTSACNKVVR